MPATAASCGRRPSGSGPGPDPGRCARHGPMSAWNAIVVEESGGGSLRRLGEADLPEGDVTVAVTWSSLNFKDGLAVTGKGKVVRRFPMVCGIDLAGTVEASDTPDWKPGDEVVLTGWDLSVTHPGGYT